MSNPTSRKNRPGRFSTLTKYLRRYRAYLLVGAIAVLLTNSFGLANPYITKIIFSKLETSAPLSDIGMLVLAMLGLAVGAGIFRFTMRRSVIWMSRRIEYDLRGEIIAHLMKLTPSYYDRTKTGDIMARVTNDLESVRQLVGPAIMQLSNTIVVATGAITMMIILSPKLTLYAMIPSIMLPFVMHRLGNLIHRKFMAIQEHFSKLTSTAQENLAGVRVVKAYRQEQAESEHFSEMSSHYKDLNLTLSKYQASFLPLIQMIGTGLGLVVVYFGGRDVITGELQLSTVVAFLLYLGMLTWPLMAVGWVVSLYQRGTASLDRINDVLFEEPDIVNESETSSADQIKGKVEFRDLTFAYNGRPVLKNINLVVEAGETLGIVGPTGSGKTTLVSLLPRLYPMEKGRIFIDDKDLIEYDLASLRRKIGFAAQEPFLFSSRLDENIGFGRDNLDRGGIQDASRAAALEKDIDLFPKGYETMVGERGITLSGGQKQRTAIARAILAEPAILVLDDATSSVDTETEHEINERIHARTRQLTTFIVSHRISSIKDADKIIYLQDGEIVETGNHEQLMTHNGRYAALYQSQLLAEEIESL